MNIANGDVFKCKEDLIVHKVNCKCVMGGGIDLEIRKSFPQLYNTYKE